MSKFHPKLLIVPVIALLTVSCSTTGLGRSWAAPDAMAAPFAKLAVVTLTKQEVYRLQAEDALVAEMTNGVASHTLLPGLSALHDTATALATLRQAGCDGLVVLRLKSGQVRPDTRSGPATTNSAGQDMGDYWVDPSAQQAESFAPGQYFAVDVRVFNLTKSKLVWSGLAIEQGATDAAELVRMVRTDVVRDLKHRGLIAK
jgi:hypothetical protein